MRRINGRSNPRGRPPRSGAPSGTSGSRPMKKLQNVLRRQPRNEVVAQRIAGVEAFTVCTAG